MVFPDNKEDEEHELTYAELDFDGVKIPESSRRLEEELASKGVVKMKKSKKRNSRRRAEDEEVIYSEIAPSQDWPEKKSNICADTDNDYEEIRCPVRWGDIKLVLSSASGLAKEIRNAQRWQLWEKQFFLWSVPILNRWFFCKASKSAIF